MCEKCKQSTSGYCKEHLPKRFFKQQISYTELKRKIKAILELKYTGKSDFFIEHLVLSEIIFEGEIYSLVQNQPVSDYDKEFGRTEIAYKVKCCEIEQELSPGEPCKICGKLYAVGYIS